MLTCILVPLDGSSRAEQALPVAARLCRALSGRLVVAQVLPYPAMVIGTIGSYVPANVYQQLADDQQKMAQTYLRQVAQRLQAEGLPVEVQIQEGEPATSLLRIASELPATLVVMTTHGRTGLARFALGSVADRMVRGGEAPVLLLRSSLDGPPAPGPTLERGLVPLDGTPLAERALDLVCQLAGPVLREVTLLRAVGPNESAADTEAARQYLDAARERLLGRLADKTCVVKTEVRAGRAADAILACAVGPNDFIIMATHGSAGIGRWVIGTVTDRVLRGGRSSLLLVHPPHGEAALER